MNAIEFEPIIKSLLDNDFYTLTVGQVAFMHFPQAIVKYDFINRGKTQFPEGFADELQRQIERMAELELTDHEYEWLDSKDLFSYDYLQFLKRFRFDPSEVDISQTDGELTATFYGKWENAIMWEVPFLALVSELYYKMTGKQPSADWYQRLVGKAKMLSENGCQWMEFGTRRRHSFEVQGKVVQAMKAYKGFLGTSNMFLAMFHGIPCLGTMSHQGPMAMQALRGAALSNYAWRNVWVKTYGNKLNIYLPDTLTTDVFLRDFTPAEASVWNLRQDSGNPSQWLDKILAFYQRIGIDPKSKKAVLSDSLNPETAVAYQREYGDKIQLSFGIGTNLSNDCGHKPLNIVIKLIGADFGNGMRPVVKLSDTNGKYTGDPHAIAATKAELRLPLTDEESRRLNIPECV